MVIPIFAGETLPGRSGCTGDHLIVPIPGSLPSATGRTVCRKTRPNGILITKIGSNIQYSKLKNCVMVSKTKGAEKAELKCGKTIKMNVLIVETGESA
ncbi:hypothetical protein [Nitratireductor sp. XY-223]|uniref:hypothetical protein n=1 Tax=Nitratireductor sp. XY-223 TaxID=2561926 RepID=UPI0010A9B44F|nr:hypothetical protein [Nitratireductor sp. XY-223]